MILARSDSPRAVPRTSDSYFMTVDSVSDPDLALLRQRIARCNARTRRVGPDATNRLRRVVVMARMGENVGKFGHEYRGGKSYNRRHGSGHPTYQYIALEHGARFDVYVYDVTETA